MHFLNLNLQIFTIKMKSYVDGANMNTSKLTEPLKLCIKI